MKKPSEIKVVKAKKTKLLPKSFSAITWFGTIYSNNDKEIEALNRTDGIDSILECHETIHVRQAEGTNDSWFCYYLKYIWQWICNLPLIFISTNMPYKFIPFELEAYAFENDKEYAMKGDCNYWKKFNKLTLKEKKKYAKDYYQLRKSVRFSYFIHRYIINNMSKKSNL
jgi:hypothetical protein